VEDRIHSPTDLDDTSRCPLRHCCGSRGAERDDLAVSTATTPLGVLCLTLCPPCAAFGDIPRVYGLLGVVEHLAAARPGCYDDLTRRRSPRW
jgi:hypothetical protein